MDSPQPESAQADWIHAGENLRRRKSSGVYYVFTKRAGKQYRRSLRTTDKATAKRLAADFLREVDRLAPADDARLTFPELAARWLAAERHSLKESTARRRETAVKSIAPAFLGLQVRSVTPRHCEEWAKARAGEVAARTFIIELETIRGVFRYAVAHGLIIRDPSANVKRPRIAARPPRVPTREQLADILADIRTDPRAQDGADLLEALAYSGMRLGEARGLRWRDVNFSQGEITVTGGERGTKNREQRTVPLSAGMRGLLERLKRERGLAAPDAFVIQVTSARKCLETACRNLRLPHFHHHSLRHYFATCAIESGVDIPTVARWMGHKDGGALLMKTYAHLQQAHSREQMRRVTFTPAVP